MIPQITRNSWITTGQKHDNLQTRRVEGTVDQNVSGLRIYTFTSGSTTHTKRVSVAPFLTSWSIRRETQTQLSDKTGVLSVMTTLLLVLVTFRKKKIRCRAVENWCSSTTSLEESVRSYRKS